MAKQSGGNTAQRVEALVRPIVEGMGLRLWDVVFEKEGPDWYLRVLIDKNGRHHHGHRHLCRCLPCAGPHPG